MVSLLSIMDTHIHIPFNRKLLQQILTLERQFIRKNEEHLAFFGGNLIGVYRPKWLEEDTLTWIEDVLHIPSFPELERAVHSHPDIEPSFHIAGSVVNLSMVYAVHKALTTKDLNEKDQYRLAHSILNLLQYKFLTSIHWNFFRRYAADESIAIAVYESLNRKTMLRRERTWQGLIHHRSDLILEPKSPRDKVNHRQTLLDFSDAEDIVGLLSDTHGKIKSIIKGLNDKYYAIRDAEGRIKLVSNFKTIGEDITLRDAKNRYMELRERLNDIIPRTSTFVRSDLLEGIGEVVTTVSLRQLEVVLRWFSDNYQSRKIAKDHEELVTTLVVYTFDFAKKRKIDVNSAADIILALLDVLRSSRATEPEVLRIRELAGNVVMDALEVDFNATVASTRIALVLYILLAGIVV